MKLTDADKLMPLFVEKAYKMEDKHGVKLGENWLLDYNDIKDVIDNAEPVIPEEFKPLIDKMVELLPKILDDVLPVVIENLTSYEERPQGDLISREALKEKLSVIQLKGNALCKVVSEKDIDDAPTITVDKVHSYDVGYSIGYDVGYSEGVKAERPQGKWIPNGDCSYRCSNCGAWDYYDFQEKTFPKYCPNCGAKMKNTEN